MACRTARSSTLPTAPEIRRGRPSNRSYMRCTGVRAAAQTPHLQPLLKHPASTHLRRCTVRHLSKKLEARQDVDSFDPPRHDVRVSKNGRFLGPRAEVDGTRESTHHRTRVRFLRAPLVLRLFLGGFALLWSTDYPWWAFVLLIMVPALLSWATLALLEGRRKTPYMKAGVRPRIYRARTGVPTKRGPRIGQSRRRRRRSCVPTGPRGRGFPRFCRRGRGVLNHGGSF
ncbi:hypothetical protein M2428_001027 [Arthrobacter sp. ES3-54]|nr:hypothetical protein [Arthrobacter sp. ES3-54]